MCWVKWLLGHNGVHSYILCECCSIAIMLALICCFLSRWYMSSGWPAQTLCFWNASTSGLVQHILCWWDFIACILSCMWCYWFEYGRLSYWHNVFLLMPGCLFDHPDASAVLFSIIISWFVIFLLRHSKIALCIWVLYLCWCHPFQIGLLFFYHSLFVAVIFSNNLPRYCADI